MKKQFLLCVSALLSITAGYSQKGGSWTILESSKVETLGEKSPLFANAKEGLTLVSIDVETLKKALATAPERWSGAPGVIISIPTLDGSAERYEVFEASNFSPLLQKNFPEIRSYAGHGLDNPTAHLRMSVDPSGIQTMVIKADSKAEFIEPYTTNAAVYAIFQSGDKRDKGKLPWSCTTREDASLINAADKLTERSAQSSSRVFKTYRLALSCTGEYGNYFNGTAGALAAMNTTMTRVNGVFEIDLALNLIMIDNETSIIYTNASTDPYSNATDMDNWNTELQNTLTSVIGEDAYDIGHLFGKTGGGGNAGCIGCVCIDGQKGSGITSPSNNIPKGDSFDIDFVAHEMGHQLGGNHSFSYNYEGVGTANISPQTEPGSGSTIMGYAGVSQGFDIQQHSDPYFTAANLKQIQSNLANKSCGQNSSMNNADFVVNAGTDYNIPKGTAFVLSGVGMSGNASNITYLWEENDPSTSTTSGSSSFPSLTKTTGANFRSLVPTATPVRYFPELETVLTGALSSTWESVSNTSRTMKFTLTGKDNVAGASNDRVGGYTKTDETSIVVKSAAGPFQVTSQATTGVTWDNNSQQTITWDVAGTTANSINCAKVDILLSTNGGQSFDTVLASGTANDGTQTITVPAGVTGTDCRVMVKSVGNVFYAVNLESIVIGYTLVTNCQTFTNNTGATIPDGNSTYTTQQVAVSGISGTVSSINVAVNATHTDLSDLTIAVQNPLNTTVNLWSAQCSSRQNLNVTFSDAGSSVVCASPTTGTYKAVGTLNNYVGSTINGNWKLRFRDTQSGDTGSINSWAVQICSSQYVLSTPEVGLSNFVVYPNPNNGTFTVEFTSQSQNDITIMVHDIRGRVVYNNKFANSGLFSGNINLNNAEQGVYLVTVQDGARKETRKIVVK